MRQSDKKGHRRSTVWLLIFFVYTWKVQAEAHEDITVIKQGQVRGTQLPSPSGLVTAFLGVPYAEPPVGVLRFKKPVPVKPWEGILDATKYGKSCSQIKNNILPRFVDFQRWFPNTELSEDCLQLNVWVPSPKPKDAPVMVYIHGGGFVTGTATLDAYDGRILAQTEGVIVVSMNYRLGFLGFLAFPGNPSTSGNAGLFDQQLALQWVQSNIEAFGGDPASVTLFGQSAGAAAITYHLLAPSSHPLFKRAILQSGSSNAPWAFSSQSETWCLSKEFARSLKCSQNSTDEVIACLQTKSIQKLLYLAKFAACPGKFKNLYFGPTVDGEFITDTPASLIKLGKFKQGEILMGFNKDEGIIYPLIVLPTFNIETESLITRKEFKEGVEAFYVNTGELGVDSIEFHYTDWADEDNPVKNREAMDDLLGDNFFVCPMSALAKHMSDHGHVYMYFFSHRSSRDVWPEWTGVMHFAELPFMFGKPLDCSKNYTKAEEALSRDMMRYWTSFARTGNPIPVGDSENKWPKFDRETQKLVTLNTGPLQVIGKYRVQQCKFWDYYFPKVLKATGSGGKGLKKEFCTETTSIPHADEELKNLYSKTT